MRRVTGEKPGGRSMRPTDRDFDLTAAVREDDSCEAGAHGDVIDGVEVVDCGRAEPVSGEVLGGLDDRGEDRPAAKTAGDDLGALLGGDERRCLRGLDAAVIEAVRQHEHVRRESVTSDVRALPGLLGLKTVELGGHGPATERTTGVVAAVGAHEVDGCVRGVAGRPAA